MTRGAAGHFPSRTLNTSETNMPILRLTKKDPTTGVTNPEEEMDLQFITYDQQAYLFDWTGRKGLLPLDAIRQALNRRMTGKDFRQIWLATDGKFNWDPHDQMQILTSRLSPRLNSPIVLSHVVRFVGLASPYDRLSFVIEPKSSEFSLDIYINTLSDNDSGRSEYMQVNSP